MGATATSVPAASVRTQQQEKRWEKLCDEFADVFGSLTKLPPPGRVQHRIELLDEKSQPPRPRIYRMSPAEMAEVRR